MTLAWQFILIIPFTAAMYLSVASVSHKGAKELYECLMIALTGGLWPSCIAPPGNILDALRNDLRDRGFRVERHASVLCIYNIYQPKLFSYVIAFIIQIDGELRLIIHSGTRCDVTTIELAHPNAISVLLGLLQLCKGNWIRRFLGPVTQESTINETLRHIVGT